MGVDRTGRFDPDEIVGRDPRRHRRSCPSSWPTTRSARSSRRPRSSRRARGRGRGRARRRVRGRRPRRRRLRRARCRPVLGHRATSSAARRAPPRSSCDAGCASRRSSSAARRSAPGAAASRTSPRSSASARPAAAIGAERSRSAHAAAHRPARAGDARARWPASSGSAIPTQRLPHLVCLGIEGVEAEPILLALDQHGVAVHSGSSCSSEALEPSPVLAAMGVDADKSLRVSVGWSSTDADVDAFLAVFPRRRRTAPRLCAPVELRRHAQHRLVHPRRPSSAPPSTSAPPPLAITFSDAPLPGVPAFDEADARAAPRRPHRPRPRRLRVLDEGRRAAPSAPLPRTTATAASAA